MGTYRAAKIVYRNTFENDRPFEREFNGIQKFEPISRTDNGQVDILHVGRNQNCFYYVMELADDQVRGQEIDPESYAPRTLSSEVTQHQRLPIQECLEIGLALTDALAHLHKNGLVHRDVKPSNVIFVDGIPKLADVGLVTDTAADMSFVGTEGFVPPEGPGTPRADIYSLGKVLYEISTGKDRKAFPEPPTLLGEFSDREEYLELSAIIARACDPDSRKRYATAEAMQADLLLLKTGKSIRRTHKLERQLKLMKRLTVGVIAIVVLGAFPYFLTIREARLARAAAKSAAEQRRRAEASEKQALTESAKSQQVAKFLEDMLNGVGPSVALGRNTTLLREILDKTAERVGHELQDQPEVQADLYDTIGNVYQSMNEYQEAEAMHRNALALRRKLFGERSPEAATSLLGLATALASQSWWSVDRLAETVPLAREALDIRKSAFGPESLELVAPLEALAEALSRTEQPQPDEAARLAREAIRLIRNYAEADGARNAYSLRILGYVLYRQNKFSEAEIPLREELSIERKQPSQIDTAYTLEILGLVYSGEGKLSEAEDSVRKAVGIWERQMGPHSQRMAIGLDKLGNVLVLEGREAEAEILYRQAIAIARELPVNPPNKGFLAETLRYLAQILAKRDRLVDAEALSREALSLRRTIWPGDATKWMPEVNGVADVLSRERKYSESEKLFADLTASVSTNSPGMAALLQARRKYSPSR